MFKKVKLFLLIITCLSFFSFNLNATDFDDEPVKSWNDDGFELLSNVNGILKIMSYTKANDFVNKGDYRIIFKDPMDGTGKDIEAVLNVTQSSSSAPMIIKFAIKGDMAPNINRYAYIKVNKGVSSTYPLGDFELTTYALRNDKSISDWNTTSQYDRAKLIISANENGSTIKMEATNKDPSNSAYTIWMNLLVEDANFSNGIGKMNGENDTIKIAFDENYILEENSTNGGTLSSRTQHNHEYYQYKLFDTNGSKIDLGQNIISSFPFQTDDGKWGFIGANYLGSGYSLWSGILYVDSGVSLNVNDTITDDFGNRYTINDINNITFNGESVTLVKISQNSTQKYVAPWENITINGNTYYKSGDILYSFMNPNIYIGQNITISGSQYKVKPTIIVNTKKVLGSNNNITNLVNTPPSGTNQTDISSLKTNIDNINLTRPTITFDTTGVKSVKTWFNGLDYDKIPVKVVHGEIVQ